VKYGLCFLVLWLGQLIIAPPAGATARKHHTPVSEPGEEAAGALSDTRIDPAKPPAVHAQSVIVIDASDGKVLYEKNADVERTIASTTKLLTALLIVESGNLDQEVTVEPIDTVCEPTKLYFKPGEHYDRRSLLFALLVHSCNDVARCLARDNAGSIFQFASKMDQRAHQLGALNSEFANPNGLPSPGEEQHSTARDLSRIARVAYANPLIRQIVDTKTLVFQYADGRTREFTNTNKVLGRYPLCNGMKTGYTDAAGHCLVSSAANGNRTVISVCLGDNQSIWNDSQRLLMWALATKQDDPHQGTPILAPLSPG
jgi:D-alanyl-D-alanine carboxypeptidase (penicillin-binding protein 5/6)